MKECLRCHATVEIADVFLDNYAKSQIGDR
jgi:hypothetical protein